MPYVFTPRDPDEDEKPRMWHVIPGHGLVRLTLVEYVVHRMTGAFPQPIHVPGYKQAMLPTWKEAVVFDVRTSTGEPDPPPKPKPPPQAKPKPKPQHYASPFGNAFGSTFNQRPFGSQFEDP